MSHATEAEAKQQMELWTNISKGMIAFTGVLTVVNAISHAGHEEHHEEEAPKFAFLKIRNKPYPWTYSDCNLFDFACKEKAAAAAKALE